MNFLKVCKTDTMFLSLPLSLNRRRLRIYSLRRYFIIINNSNNSNNNYYKIKDILAIGYHHLMTLTFLSVSSSSWERGDEIRKSTDSHPVYQTNIDVLIRVQVIMIITNEKVGTDHTWRKHFLTCVEQYRHK